MILRAKALAAALALLAGLGFPATVLADRCPCGDLILPYFEVQMPAVGQAPYQLQTTLFSVSNRGEDPLTVDLTVWTNWAQPMVTTRVELDPHSIFPVNLRDWLVFGQLPDRQLAEDELAHVTAALCGDPSPRTGLWYGTKVGQDLAVGFVTMTAVRTPWSDFSDLWGDFFSVDASRDFAAGESLVRMVGDTSREVCERHLLRFMENGESLATKMVFWTGVGGPPSSRPEPRFEPLVAECEMYNEKGRYLGPTELELLATQAMAVAALDWPEALGWVDCTTPVSSFTCLSYAAEGRYTMTLRSFCEEEEAAPPTPPGLFGSIRLEKATEGEDADLPTGPELVVGDPVGWTYEVTNLGNVVLTEVKVVDDQEVAVVCPADRLEPGESMTCTAGGLVTEGQYRNVATASGRIAHGKQVTDSDPSHYYGSPDVPPPPPPPPPPEASVEIEKLTGGEDADLPPGPTVVAGETVGWTYGVTNTGTVALNNIQVTDDQGVSVSCPASTLAVGQSMTCTASGPVGVGQYSNLGTVAAQDPAGRPVTDSDPSHCFGEEPPPEPEVAVAIEKYTNGEDADDPPGPKLTIGDEVVWTYQVTNTGNVPLHGIAVVDDQGVTVSCPSTSLDPGQSMTCTASGLALEDLYTNLGSVTAFGPDPEPIEATDDDPSHYTGLEGPAGDEGCTPGFWKNHLPDWLPTPYAPDHTVVSAFAEAGAYTQGDSTLLEALDFGGGPGVEGAVQILLRAAVAALLNASHPSVDYDRTPAQVIVAVDGALASGSRDVMLVLAADLDASNNYGCPIGQPR